MCWPRIRWMWATLLLAGLSHGQAQTLRDPTVPPPEALPATAPDGQPARAKGEPPPSASILIVREGQAAVVSGTRLYGQGQSIGQSNIERITETEVWFREAGTLRKVPRYAGIERGPALPDCPAVAPKAQASAAAAAPAKTVRARKPVSKPKLTPTARPTLKPSLKPARKPAQQLAPPPVPEVPCFGGQPKGTP